MEHSRHGEDLNNVGIKITAAKANGEEAPGVLIRRGPAVSQILYGTARQAEKNWSRTILVATAFLQTSLLWRSGGGGIAAGATVADLLIEPYRFVNIVPVMSLAGEGFETETDSLSFHLHRFLGDLFYLLFIFLFALGVCLSLKKTHTQKNTLRYILFRIFCISIIEPFKLSLVTFLEQYLGQSQDQTD